MERDLLRRALRDAALLLVAASALGLVYNSATPLGVTLGARISAPSSNPTASAIYSNETVAITPQTQRTTPAPNARIQNETLGISVVPAKTATSDPTPDTNNTPAMTWPQVKELAEKNQIVLVDAREPSAFEAGHVPNAVSLPTRLLRENIDNFMAEVPRDKPIAVYCANPRCPLSRNLARALVEQYGYKDVRNVPGGYTEWLVNQSGR